VTLLTTNTDINGKYNFIICNPPYVRHHLIDENIKNIIRYKTRLISGFDLSGLAGLYCHFLLQSVQCMDEEAVAGWLIPSEFMDVNYGKSVKEFLLSKVELFRVHRFDPSDAQFEDALVSSVVIWFRKKLPTAKNQQFRI
jgi:methylase of polypeptide subunit release factors